MKKVVEMAMINDENSHDETLGDTIMKYAQNPPVQVEELANDLGIDIQLENLGDDISGLIQRKSNNQYLIKVNSKHSERRQRFTIAHEVAHYVLHKDQIGDGIVDNAKYRANNMNDHDETMANTLAVDILMPANVLKQEYKKNRSIAPLANKFDVSYDAMAYRLKNLGLNP